jgi:hypothetical protein
MRRLGQQIGLHSFVFVFLVLALGSLAVPAIARTITVRCDGNATISNALKTLDPQVSNTVRVVGTCTDSIRIDDFAQLSIIGDSTGGKNAVIEGLNGHFVL